MTTLRIFYRERVDPFAKDLWKWAVAVGGLLGALYLMGFFHDVDSSAGKHALAAISILFIGGSAHLIGKGFTSDDFEQWTFATAIGAAMLACAFAAASVFCHFQEKAEAEGLISSFNTTQARLVESDREQTLDDSAEPLSLGD